jgi:hypothetical protein
MAAFAERTGLASTRPPRRYLWTDSFAVCNYLALARRTGEDGFLDLALRLVDQVHHVLGRFREDDARSGWISGLDDHEGELHPTRGGLRIGKSLPERGPDDPFDERLEWERDGQYFHYLTRWMHALDQVGRTTGDRRFHRWACDLAATAHRAFVYGAPLAGSGRMVWKMSTDLTRPLVTSMGQHDPLDGLVTCAQLEEIAAASAEERAADLDVLARAAEDYAAMAEATDFHTADPLGLGGLLADAYRLAQLGARGALDDLSILQRVLVAALDGVRRATRDSTWRQPAPLRLAFRELGLAIGLASVEPLARTLNGGVGASQDVPRAHVRALADAVPLAGEIRSFWLVPTHRTARSWTDHRDINEVMLASSLLPEGYLELASART